MPTRTIAALLVMLSTSPLGAQTSPSAVTQRLFDDARVRESLDQLRAEEPWVIEQQIALCEIPAPPFGEAERAAAYRTAFVELGLQDVRIDDAGNVIGVRPGRTASPNLLFTDVRGY